MYDFDAYRTRRDSVLKHHICSLSLFVILTNVEEVMILFTVWLDCSRGTLWMEAEIQEVEFSGTGSGHHMHHTKRTTRVLGNLLDVFLLSGVGWVVSLLYQHLLCHEFIGSRLLADFVGSVMDVRPFYKKG